MKSFDEQPTFPPAGWGRKGLVLLMLAALLGGGMFLATLRRPVPVPDPVETHRRDLELREGRWRQPGQTNGFTGFLLDTYDDGTRKSRSAVSNGLLAGLSLGWHTNGLLQVEEFFVEGISHGRRSKWHPNGQKESEVTVVQGALDGTFRSWHDNGAPAEEVELKAGRPEGRSRAWYPSGLAKAEVTVANGKVVRQSFWKDGEGPESPAQLSRPVPRKVHER